MNLLQQLQEQIKNMWQNFSKTQKIVISGSALLVFGLLIFTAFFWGKNDYQPLYPNLDLNDSAMISAKLKDLKIDYKLADDGTTILVPTALKHQLRLDLANELPQGGVIGFESFDKSRFGETDTDKRVRFLAALQGELTRTIQEMAEVDLAKVHIVLPEPSLFISEDKPAKASVLLKLKPYTTMDNQKVKSIVYFLSHSVEGLSPENVTVIDVYGNLLSENIITGEQDVVNGSLTTTQMNMKKQFEDNLSNSLQTMLEKVKGPGKAVVRASVELDFDQVETSTEEYGDSVLRSEQIKEEFSEGVTASPGIAGTESNLPDTISYQSTENNQTSSGKLETIKNYEINRFIESRKKAPGEIKRLSVAVIIDGELTAPEQEEIEDIVSKAAGINVSRGDSVSVTSLVFNTDSYNTLQAQLQEEALRQQRMELIKYIVPGFVFIVLVVLGILLMRRRSIKQQPPLIKTPQTVSSYEEMLASLSPEDEEKIQVQKRIEKIAKTQPDSVAKVIRTWLAEDTR